MITFNEFTELIMGAMQRLTDFKIPLYILITIIVIYIGIKIIERR